MSFRTSSLSALERGAQAEPREQGTGTRWSAQDATTRLKSSRHYSVRRLQRVSSRRIRPVVLEESERPANAKSTATQSH